MENMETQEIVVTSNANQVSDRIHTNSYYATDQHALTIELIILEIFKNLNSSELLICRRINSQFKHLATKVLRSRTSLVVVFDYLLNWGSPYHYTCPKKSRSTLISTRKAISKPKLDDFTKLVMGTQFPCTSFKFCGGPLNSKDFQNFTKCYGHEIKEISLELNFPPDSAQLTEKRRRKKRLEIFQELKTLLSEQLPSVKYLHLNQQQLPLCSRERSQILFSHASDLAQVYNLKLPPNLKKLFLGNNIPFWLFTKVLSVPNNLPIMLQVESQKQYQEVIWANKFHLLSHFHFHPPLNNIDFYECHLSSKTKPQRLNSITITLDALILRREDLKARISHVLSDILESSSKSLNRIELHSPLGMLCGFNLNDTELKIPPLPNVTCLTVSTGEYDIPTWANKIIPRALAPEFKSKFPALRIVKFNFEKLWDNSNWENFFELNDILWTVQSLIFTESTFVPSNCFYYCCKIFPNVKSLAVRIQRLSIQHAVMNGLWNFAKLRVLKLDINVENEQNAYPKLDEAFTGFSGSTCAELLNCIHAVDGSTVRNLRVNPSMVKLKDFRKLEITMVDNREISNKEVYPHFFSHVTGLYGFRMCPKLEVELGYHIKCQTNLKQIHSRMSPILPYLQLRLLSRTD